MKLNQTKIEKHYRTKYSKYKHIADMAHLLDQITTMSGCESFPGSVYFMVVLSTFTVRHFVTSDAKKSQYE